MKKDIRKKVIVVGSGFGGIAAALRLKKKGYEVTLLEKHNDLGGRAKTFRRGNFIYDGGPTVITAPYLFEELLNLFNKKLSNYTKIVPLDLWYRFVFHDGSSFDYCGDEKKITDEIKKIIDHASKESEKNILEITKKFHSAMDRKKNSMNLKIELMKDEAFKEAKDNSISIALESVERIISSSIDRKKLDKLFNDDLFRAKEVLKKL